MKNPQAMPAVADDEDDDFDDLLDDANGEMSPALDDLESGLSTSLRKWLATTAAGLVWSHFGKVEQTLTKAVRPVEQSLNKVLLEKGAAAQKIGVASVLDGFLGDGGTIPAGSRLDRAELVRSGVASRVPAFQNSARQYGDGLADTLNGLIAADVRAGVPVSETARKVGLVLQDIDLSTKDGASAAIAGELTSRARVSAERYVNTELAAARSYQQQRTIAAIARVVPGVKQRWVTAPGCCDDCSELDGEEVGLGEAFSSGDYAPPLHPNCKCELVASTGDDESSDETDDNSEADDE